MTAAEYGQIVDALPEQNRDQARGPNRRLFADNIIQVMALAQEGWRLKLDQTQLFKTLVRFQTERALARLTAAELSKTDKPSENEPRRITTIIEAIVKKAGGSLDLPEVKLVFSLNGNYTGTLTPVVEDVPADRVVITVGDEKVTAAEFNRMADATPEQFNSQDLGANRKLAAENLMRTMALAQEGRRLKLDEVQSFKAFVHFQTESVLANLTFTELTKTDKPSEAELRRYYDEHRADYREAHASHILIRFQGSPVPLRTGQRDLTEAEALAKITYLRQKAQGGEDFATLARRESDDPTSSAKGGDLGTFHHGQMVAAFERAAFALKPGELSQPVKTQFGYHLIKMESKETSFEEERASIETAWAGARTQKIVEDTVKKAGAVLDSEFFPVNPAK
jgi:peptidyl-prolyl cis-trans isomerase C